MLKKPPSLTGVKNPNSYSVLEPCSNGRGNITKVVRDQGLVACIVRDTDVGTVWPFWYLPYVTSN